MDKKVEARIKKERAKRERQIRIHALHEAGYSDSEIAKTIGVSEGTVRNILQKDLE